jgi:hypothetical protein
MPLKTVIIPPLRNKREAIALRVQEGRIYKSIDEIRASAGLPPMGKERLGDLVLNPSYFKGTQAGKRRRKVGQI